MVGEIAAGNTLPMAAKNPLEVYLNDHLAGATAGRDLARKLVKDAAGTPHEPVLAEMLADIETDRDSLQDVMKRLGIEQHPSKQAGTWLVEKLGRVRFSEPLTGSADLSRVLEMEGLSMGIVGKRGLWEALQESYGNDSRLADVDLETLINRAQHQLDTVAQQHRAAAAKAFSG